MSEGEVLDTSIGPAVLPCRHFRTDIKSWIMGFGTASFVSSISGDCYLGLVVMYPL